MVFTYTMIIISTGDIVIRTLPALYDRQAKETINVFSVIELILIAWFTLEFIGKLIICPDKLRFLFTLYTIFDLIAIVPYYIYLGYPYITLIRIFKDSSRIFKIITLLNSFQKWDSLNTIMHTLKISYKEILVFLIYLVITIIFFSTIQYYIESSTPNSLFVSIPQTCWWCLVSLNSFLIIFI